ncbi:hypothetical protein BpHYR1_025001 [Brachionus plicatilis]|uniref:TRAF-type domain-containing protein n=1 Tax=Brachionus plicatilis TaxID=10195 RepID=A0A3M7PUN4_BRAPC|nr:hypothetical protein BpHYR1_025001 [Brachionus plicatilis]
MDQMLITCGLCERRYKVDDYSVHLLDCQKTTCDNCGEEIKKAEEAQHLLTCRPAVVPIFSCPRCNTGLTEDEFAQHVVECMVPRVNCRLCKGEIEDKFQSKEGGMLYGDRRTTYYSHTRPVPNTSRNTFESNLNKTLKTFLNDYKENGSVSNASSSNENNDIEMTVIECIKNGTGLPDQNFRNVLTESIAILAFKQVKSTNNILFLFNDNLRYFLIILEKEYTIF